MGVEIPQTDQKGAVDWRSPYWGDAEWRPNLFDAKPVWDADWKEEEHPRGKGSRFVKKGSGGASRRVDLMAERPKPPEETGAKRSGGIWNPPAHIVSGKFGKEYVKAQLANYRDLARKQVDKYLDEGDPHRAEAARFMDSAMEVAEELGDDALLSVAVGEDGEPIGAAVMDKSDGYIPMVGSTERGYGKVIMRDLINKAKDAGLSEVHLESVQGAKKFYQRLGFKPAPDPSGRWPEGGGELFGLTPMSLKISEATLDEALDSPDAEADEPEFLTAGKLRTPVGHPADRDWHPLLHEPAGDWKSPKWR